MKKSRTSRGPSITATYAAKSFGGLVDRVRETGVAYIVERKGRPIAQIAPIGRRQCTMAELAEWFEAHRAQADDFAEAVREQVKVANRPAVPVNRWPR